MDAKEWFYSQYAYGSGNPNGMDDWFRKMDDYADYKDYKRSLSEGYKTKPLTRAEIQLEFYKKTGTDVVNSQGEFDIDYVQWLEEKIITTKK